MSWTPLHYVTYTRNKELVELLCDNGANPNAQDATGSTALHIARRYYSDNRQIRDLLCSFGADQEAKDFLGLRPKSYNFRRNRNTFHDIVGFIAGFVRNVRPMIVKPTDPDFL